LDYALEGSSSWCSITVIFVHPFVFCLVLSKLDQMAAGSRPQLITQETFRRCCNWHSIPLITSSVAERIRTDNWQNDVLTTRNAFRAQEPYRLFL
jgi:hypothetical protein